MLRFLFFVGATLAIVTAVFLQMFNGLTLIGLGVMSVAALIVFLKEAK